VSIIITNIDGSDDGVCTYALKINAREIARFEHNRLDGLAKCLRLAADAAERQHWAHMHEVMNGSCSQ
jgi:hypothetical protein